MDGWEINTSDLKVYALHPTPDTIGIKITIKATKKLPEGPIEEYIPIEIIYEASQRDFFASADGKKVTFYKVLKFIPEKLELHDVNENYTLDYSRLFPPIEGMHFTVPILFLPQALNNKIQNFWRATRGFPAGVSGEFWRMLYLSAITITTVGYGDIVPLTTTARLLIACEAVLGIVVIGLFLNSLVGETSPRRAAGK